MSEPDNNHSTAAAAGDDEEDCGGGGSTDDRKKQKREGRIRKAKKSALFRFRKLRNQLQRKKRRISSSNFGCLGKRSGSGGGGCCLSLNLRKKSPKLDSSPVESQTSDPNSPDFTLDLLKGLIEKNDFYSSECNTHFDVDSD